jgi:predicted nucleotide-binding protein (sugar kinase/HSP70/actin superfamily)
MEYLTPNFTKDMLDDYIVLIPNMAPVQFACLKPALESEGYHVEMLSNRGSEVAQLGLRYVHNDTCYPALLIIGQFLDALNSGKYDLHHTALLISQSGGGCRASNYIKLLRKALVKSGYGYIPVASVNASGLEADSSMPLTPKLLEKLLAGAEYGDEISALRNQIVPYENNKGDGEKWCQKWIDTVHDWFFANKNYSIPAMKKRFKDIAQDAMLVPITRVPKVKVGVVGEIYVKFSPLGNNDLQKFLESEGCEVNMPGLMGYINYCCANWNLDMKFYGMSKAVGMTAGAALKLFDSIGKAQSKAMEEAGFYAPGSFKELMKKPEGILSLGVKMGEGWLLTGEMVELIEGGYSNIVCAQPFGCLPNHIAGKGVTNRIRALHPDANITAVDYDPSSTKVNQENRIKLMLAVAKENLEKA